MDNMKLPDGEFRLLSIIWDEEPLKSGDLAKLALDELGWKRTTTYTVLKRLASRGIVKNEDAVVTSIYKKDDIQKHESRAVMEKSFDNSLPSFIAAFLGDKKISAREAEELKQLIDEHKEGFI